MVNDFLGRALRVGLSEIGVILALGLAALGLLAFAGIADEMGEGGLRGFDQTILLALREPGDLGDPIGPEWLEEAVRDVTSLGGFTLLTLIVGLVAIYLVAEGKRVSALLAVSAVASGTLLSEGLKLGFARPRPELAPHMVEVYSASFPSGHALLSAIAYLTLGAMLARASTKRRIKTLALMVAAMLTILVGLSRIYLGVHWPSDVLAGWALGAAWAALWWLFAWWLDRRAAAAARP